jgi:hypothetical protein
VYMRIMEQLGFFSALGVVIVFIAAAAFGRIMSVPAGIRTVEPVSDPVTDAVPARTEPTETLPTRTAPARTVLTRTAPAEPVPAETVPVQKVRTEDTQTIG